MITKLPDEHWLDGGGVLEGATNSFIVVIRSEPQPVDGVSTRWHGSVEHAQSHEHTYFIDYPRLMAFIASHCPPPPGGAWRARLSRRWQKSALQHWLNPITYTAPADCLQGAK